MSCVWLSHQKPQKAALSHSEYLGKKEREGTVKTIYVKIDYRIVATKFRKSKLKCDILMWNAENSAI